MFSTLTKFLSNRSRHVMLDGCRSKLVNVVSGAAHGNVFGSVIVPSVHLAAFSIMGNKLMGYADSSTLMAVLPSTGVRVIVAESLIRDFGRVREWRDLWGMKLNATKTKTMIVSRSS